ncbi:Osteoclast-stimulating factor 1 [Intoshia linei]|uniref:Osteoclast-stimulating factor 1 n=1 Tax=Intoshia linei TaxID=1819745 RepID=A0A177B299_9BILA|nr:Osteoclast-stimulating factor 1 [Intoshia linei]
MSNSFIISKADNSDEDLVELEKEIFKVDDQCSHLITKFKHTSQNVFHFNRFYRNRSESVNVADQRVLQQLRRPPVRADNSNEEENDIRTIQICIFGGAKVGKTTLISKLISRKLPRRYVPTIEENYWVEFKLFDDIPIHMKICDTAGSCSFTAMQRLHMAHCDACILIYDVYDDNSIKFLQCVYQNLKTEPGFRIRLKKKIYLMGNAREQQFYQCKNGKITSKIHSPKCGIVGDFLFDSPDFIPSTSVKKPTENQSDVMANSIFMNSIIKTNDNVSSVKNLVRLGKIVRKTSLAYERQVKISNENGRQRSKLEINFIKKLYLDCKQSFYYEFDFSKNKFVDAFFTDLSRIVIQSRISLKDLNRMYINNLNNDRIKLIKIRRASVPVEMYRTLNSGKRIEQKKKPFFKYMTAKLMSGILPIRKGKVEIYQSNVDYNEGEFAFNEGDIIFVEPIENNICNVTNNDKIAKINYDFILKNATKKNEYLHEAARRGNVDVIKNLIKKRVSMNLIDSSGSTPLHWLSRNGNVDAVMTLLSQKCNVNAQNKLGDTALHNAALKGHIEIIKILYAHSANFDILNLCNKKPIHVARNIEVKAAINELLHGREEYKSENESTDSKD